MKYFWMAATAIGLGLSAWMGFAASADAKPVSVVCAIPTGEYGTGSTQDIDGRLNRDTLSCTATIGDVLPATTVEITGAEMGTFCEADGRLTLDWLVKISATGRVTMKCYFASS